MSEKIQLYYYGGERCVGVGEEVVVSDRHNSLSIEKITEITSATIKTTSRTFSKKSKKERGSGDSWYYAKITGMYPEEARLRIEERQKEDEKKLIFLKVKQRMDNEYRFLSTSDLFAIVAILDDAKSKEEDGL